MLLRGTSAKNERRSTCQNTTTANNMKVLLLIPEELLHVKVEI